MPARSRAFRSSSPSMPGRYLRREQAVCRLKSTQLPGRPRRGTLRTRSRGRMQILTVSFLRLPRFHPRKESSRDEREDPPDDEEGEEEGRTGEEEKDPRPADHQQDGD